MSKSITITCTQDTYLDSSSNADYSNASYLKSKRWYPNDTPGFIPILQFDIPSEVKYSKIISAKVYYTMQQVDAIDTIYGAHVRAFSASNIIVSNIRYNNYSLFGAFTEPIDIVDQVILSTVGGGYPSTYATSADVTSLLQNNIINDIFTIAINLKCNLLYTRIRGYGSASPITLKIEYENVIPDPPTLLYPIDVYLNQDNPITFKWVYNTQSGAKQSKFEIDWKKSNEQAWVSLVSKNGVNNRYTVPANTFPVDKIDWRCRSTDELGQVSEYSIGSFLIKGKPLSPFVTNIMNDSLTTITWNATDQIAREIELLKDGERIDYSKKSTADNTYLPNMFLKDGTYEFRIRIMNSYNMWSDYTSRIFIISTPKPDVAHINISLNGNEVTIISNGPGYLYRREGNIDTLIHVFETSGTYKDKSILHGLRTGYFLRKYDVGYSDSAIHYVTAIVDGFIISNGKVSVNLINSTDAYMPYQAKESKESVLTNYSGRKYPVLESGEFESLTISRSCYISKEQFNDLRDIYFDTLPIIYRDNRGQRFNCHISEPSITNTFLDKGYVIDLTFTKLESEEVSLR